MGAAPVAGVENFRAVIDDDRHWTCAKGVYADPVAEHALGLLLAGRRGLAEYARRWKFDRRDSNELGHSLYDSRIVVLGGGGITESLLKLLRPFRADVTVVRRTAQEMPGAKSVVGVGDLHRVLPGADAVVLALAAAPTRSRSSGETSCASSAGHLVGQRRPRRARRHRGPGRRAARRTARRCALDVTDPEPLPEDTRCGDDQLPDHPHVGNTELMARPLLAARVTENVRRYAAGDRCSAPSTGLGY